MKKRILLIRNAAATDFGGAERVPVFIASELLSHGFEPIILSRSQKLLAFADEQGVPSLRSWWWSRQAWNGKRILLFPAYFIWQLILYIYYVVTFVRHHAEAVHIQSKDDFIAGSVAARTLGINVFWTDHADLKHIWANHSIWYKNPVGKLVYWAARFARTIIVVSENDKRTLGCLIPEGAVRNKLQVVHNGVFDQYRPTKKESTFTFISTARLVTDKGIAELIEAFELFSKDHHDAQLHLVGDGPERAKFERMAKGVKNIYFLGHQSEPLPFLSSAHVFVLPTYHEGFSIALLEACMEKIAIIATDVGGNPEIIEHEKNGLLIKSKQVKDLCDAMKRLYEQDAYRQKLADNARKKYLLHFNLKTIIEERLLPFYKGIYS